MANYFINHFSTGVKDTHAEAALALEALIEALDTSENPLVGQGIAYTKRGSGGCIGWAIYELCFLIDSADHLHYADNIVLTVP